MVHNYDDDKKYVTHEFDDECSQYTTGATWNYGGEYFFCTFRCRVPRRIADKSHLVDEFIERHQDDRGFWLPNL